MQLYRRLDCSRLLFNSRCSLQFSLPRFRWLPSASAWWSIFSWWFSWKVWTPTQVALSSSTFTLLSQCYSTTCGMSLLSSMTGGSVCLLWYAETLRITHLGSTHQSSMNAWNLSKRTLQLILSLTSLLGSTLLTTSKSGQTKRKMMNMTSSRSLWRVMKSALDAFP